MDMREAFEAWYQRHYPTATPSSYSKINGRYVDVEVSVAWEAWQAALSHIGDGSKAEPVAWVDEAGNAMSPCEKTDLINMGGDDAVIASTYDRPAYFHPAPTAQDSKVPEELKAEILTFCELVENPEEIPMGTWGVRAHKKITRLRELLSAAPVPAKPQWVSCEERLPTEADADPEGMVWTYHANWLHTCHWRTVRAHHEREGFTHWMPTGLVRPPAPEGE